MPSVPGTRVQAPPSAPVAPAPRPQGGFDARRMLDPLAAPTPAGSAPRAAAGQIFQ
jgi:hypothetical protein